MRQIVNAYPLGTQRTNNADIDRALGNVSQAWREDAGTLTGIPDADAPRLERLLLWRGGYDPFKVPEHAEVTKPEFMRRTLAALLSDLVNEFEQTEEEEQIRQERAEKAKVQGQKPVKITVT